MPKGDYLESMLLDTLFVNGTFTKPTNIHVALYTTNPTDADTGTELTGTGYARVQVANNGTTFSRTGNTVTNTGAIAFPERTGTAATVTHVGLRTAATGGSLLYHQPLASSVSISNAVPTVITIAAGALTIAED